MMDKNNVDGNDENEEDNHNEDDDDNYMVKMVR